MWMAQKRTSRLEKKLLVLLQERYPISIATKFCSCSFDKPLLCRGNSKHTTKHVQLNIKLIFFSYEIRGIRKKNCCILAAYARH